MKVKSRETKKSLVSLFLLVMRPEEFSLDPDDAKDVSQEKLYVDIATPYEQDHSGEFRPQLIAACKEVKGLDACLTLNERQKMKEVRGRRLGLQNSKLRISYTR